MRQSRDSGFTLLITLVFLQLISMLAIYELARAAREVKAIHRMDQASQRLQAARIVLSSVVREFMTSGLPCEVERMSVHKIDNLPTEWWHSHACKKNLNHQHFDLVVENLGEDGCAFINDAENNQIITPIFYRITLLTETNDESAQNKIILQSTLAKQSVKRLSCVSAGHPHEVSLGLQTTRLLTSLRNV